MLTLNLQQHPLVFLPWFDRFACCLVFFGSSLFSLLANCQPTLIDYHYSIVAEHPHDTTVFTQGLVFHNGLLFEGSGLRGHSQVFSRTLQSTQALKSRANDASIFGEGITIFGNKLYQLSWQEQRGFIYQLDDLAPIASFPINGEGWGLTHNNQHLIISNGSNQLQFINPHNFTLEKIVNVTLAGKPLAKLNELEWVEGLIYANVWQTNWIVMIDPRSGNVVGKVRLNQLLPDGERTKTTDVLNGIAYDQSTKRLWVTGKNWPKLYQIELHTSSVENAANSHAQTPVR